MKIFQKSILFILISFTILFYFNLNSYPYTQQEVIKLKPLGDRWAVVIGISSYKDKKLNLKYADNDARSFYNALKDKCRFDDKHIRLLLNEDATRENIRKNIDGWLYQNTKESDKIIVFFSGHGTQDLDNNKDEDDGYDEFLVPYDFDDSDISTAIIDDVFAYWIINLKSENITLIFDSCYSGGAAKAKGFNHIKTRGEIKVDNFVKDIFKEVPKDGVALISACKDNQLSYETDDLKMGVFTHFLLDSFDKKSDKDMNNRLTIEEIFDNLKLNVLDFTRKNFRSEQEPALISTMKKPFELVYFPVESLTKSENKKKEIKNIISQAHRTQDLRRRISLLEEAVEMDPADYNSRYFLADAYREFKNYDEALYSYEIALSINDFQKDSIYVSISELYIDKGEIEKAEDYLRKAIEINKNYNHLNKLAALLNKNKDLNEAISTYIASLNLNKRQREAYFELGRLFIKQENYDEAISIIEKGIKINPAYYEYYYLKGLLYRFIKKDEKIGNELVGIFHKMTNYVYTGDVDDSEILWEKDEFRNLIIKNAKQEINNHGFLVESYTRLIKIYTKFQKDINEAKKYFNELIYQYPFFKNVEEITSLFKDIPSKQNSSGN